MRLFCGNLSTKLAGEKIFREQLINEKRDIMKIKITLLKKSISKGKFLLFVFFSNPTKHEISNYENKVGIFQILKI